MAPVTPPVLDEVVVSESQRRCFKVTLFFLRLLPTVAIACTVHWVARVAGTIQELGLVAGLFRLCHVILIVGLNFLAFLVRKLQLIPVEGLLPLSYVRRHYFRLLTTNARLLILHLSPVYLVANHTPNAIFEVGGAVVLLWVLKFLLGHWMLLGGGSVGLLDHNIGLILSIWHSSSTDTWFCPQLLVSLSPPHLTRGIAQTFLLYIFEFLLTSCKIRELSKFGPWITIDRPSHCFIFF